MHLKNIKLSGFKSFVDPTTVPFEQNLIAVVGPNGCGKSNIVDAIRWVMGESSAKTLRGESMSDVIFNGSSTRKPVGQASVQLTFDNSDDAIGGEYAEYNEIAIKRVATRDGTSSYYLNNTKCRRKDITDVFLGTGLGPRSYSVIEQGMISRFIEAKPDDLRVYIEEAAGISKYKERRRETENRIRHTRENLERVADLREEIGGQLEKLQRQAKAAERYKVLKQDERLNKAQLCALHWQALDEKMQGFEQLIKEAEVEIEKKVAEKRHFGSEIEKFRDAQTDASDELNEVQGGYYGLGAEIAKIEQSITHHKERYQQLQDDKLQIEQSSGELQQNTQADQRHLTELQQELASIEPQFNRARETYTQSAATLVETESTMTTWQQQWDDFTAAAAQAMQTAEVEQTRLQHAEQTIKALSVRIEKLTVEESACVYGDLAVEIDQITVQQQQVEIDLNAVVQSLTVATDEISRQRQQMETTNKEIDIAKEALQKAKGRYASLTALQQAAMGIEDEKIVKWLETNNLQQQPRLLQQLQVDNGWEKAVETVLGSHLQAICIDDYAAAEQLLNNAPDGTFEFFIADNNSTATAAANLLLSKVNVNKNVATLLENIYCADSLASAKQIMPKLTENQSVVTKDGIWLSKQWLRVAKDKDEKSGILQRKRQLEELNAEIKTLETEVEKLQQQFQQAKQNLQQAEQKKETLQQQSNQVIQSFADVRAQYQVKQQQLQQMRQRARQLATELTEQRNNLQQQQILLEQSRKNWQQATEDADVYAKQKSELEMTGVEHRQRLLNSRQKAQGDAENKHQLEVRVEQLKPQIITLEESIQRAEKQLQVLFTRSTILKASLDKGEGPVAELQTQLEQILNKRVTVEHELTEVRNKVENITHKIREFEESKEQCAQEVETMRRGLEEQRLQGRTIDIRKKTFEEQLVEIGYVLMDVLQDLPDEAVVAAWEEEAQRIANRISRLGAINLAAIDEYKIQEERKQYLDSQYDDLMEALTTLENAIRKIDKETRSRFKETFDKVNDGFQKLFPRVFGGGSAHLELTGEDLLDTGIGVIARPPGKRNTTIHLLSGGEKALTAVSLVFAIFQLNPAPFCLLDEVDAPLDDTNVGRFCSLVKEMSEKVQFLFISHNKLAIEMANQLTGVTMHEPGVSRIVAVDMEEAVQLAVA